MSPSSLARLHDRVYDELATALREGWLMPGEKITIRRVAELAGASMTPARQALARLVEQGALDASQGKSLRVPVMTVARWDEIGAMRIALETLAIGLAADRISAEELASLRDIASRLATARRARDHEVDRTLVARFQLGAYAGAHAPVLERAIKDLWLMTGPYLRMLYPDYIATVPADWRGRLCDSLKRRDAAGARAEIGRDLADAFKHVRGLANARGLIVPLAHRK